MILARIWAVLAVLFLVGCATEVDDEELWESIDWVLAADIHKPGPTVTNSPTPSPTATPTPTTTSLPPPTITQPTAGLVSGDGEVGVYKGGYADLVCQYDWDCSYANAIVACESEGDPGAYNSSGYVGLFQVHESYAPNLTDPATNIAVAYSLYLSGGWSHWPNCP